jgi:hypothetical protein
MDAGTDHSATCYQPPSRCWRPGDLLAFGSPLLECLDAAWPCYCATVGSANKAQSLLNVCPGRQSHSARRRALAHAAAELHPCKCRSARRATPPLSRRSQVRASAVKSLCALPCAGHAREPLPICPSSRAHAHGCIQANPRRIPHPSIHPSLPRARQWPLVHAHAHA